MSARIVVLLRGVNVGGHNRVPMADLRAELTTAGFTAVTTYIQSGNVVVGHPSGDAETAAAHVRSVIATSFGIDVPAIGVSARHWRELADANPFPDEQDAKRVHAIVLPTTPDEAVLAAVAVRQAASDDKGRRDVVTVIGRVAYLHTPDGFGTSDLAKALAAGRGPLADGTARNWATVTALLALVEEHVTDP